MTSGIDSGSSTGSASSVSKRAKKKTTGPYHNSKYKAKMCRNWVKEGTCPYSEKCQFAHGAAELEKWNEIRRRQKLQIQQDERNQRLSQQEKEAHKRSSDRRSLEPGLQDTQSMANRASGENGTGSHQWPSQRQQEQHHHHHHHYRMYGNGLSGSETFHSGNGNSLERGYLDTLAKDFTSNCSVSSTGSARSTSTLLTNGSSYPSMSSISTHESAPSVHSNYQSLRQPMGSQYNGLQQQRSQAARAFSFDEFQNANSRTSSLSIATYGSVEQFPCSCAVNSVLPSCNVCSDFDEEIMNYSPTGQRRHLRNGQQLELPEDRQVIYQRQQSEPPILGILQQRQQRDFAGPFAREDSPDTSRGRSSMFLGSPWDSPSGDDALQTVNSAFLLPSVLENNRF